MMMNVKESGVKSRIGESRQERRPVWEGGRSRGQGLLKEVRTELRSRC